MRIIILILLVGFIIAPLAFYVIAVESSANSHNLSDSTTGTYLEFSEAIKVTNSCGSTLFIPSKTSAEWTSFNNSALSCLTKTGDFIECASSITGNACGGSIIYSSISAGESWAACKSWAEGKPDGTCLKVISGGDNDCELYNGTSSGGASNTGSCTDYD